ncbi:peptide chain release factor N(5)-glutamine methyltransferase [candidate division WOR-3 bacterium]|uniref:Release factor glutamine methyltransferase n=1 Tax=candidate division WOR-3 bacterium TaxID=2052148 RepID=A0A937XDR4_UNCW3|nr:peptide chain release factor N(5)-glutamine methyltransferase [candidate division WOR-3 bacterium]
MSEPSRRTRNLATKPPRHKGPEVRIDSAELLKEASGAIPRSDAEYLLMHLLQVPRHELYLRRPVTAREAARFRRLVSLARSGEPVQYLTHSAPFLDFQVQVDHRVLIPRPETEELVARTLSKLKSEARSRKPKARTMAVDFGTGSGCIAIALARALPQASILAVDASVAALAVARRNVVRHSLGDKVRLAQARNMDDRILSRLRGRLDLLISNPPYIPTRRLARLQPSVRREPRLALDGGPKGANIVAMLVAHGPTLLKPGGLLAVEVDATHESAVRKLAPHTEVERDLAGRVRYAFLRRS